MRWDPVVAETLLWLVRVIMICSFLFHSFSSFFLYLFILKNRVSLIFLFCFAGNVLTLIKGRNWFVVKPKKILDGVK